MDQARINIADKPNAYASMQLRMHPRVFAALGKDLVTNDVVAVIELVKNSYDAFARNVWVEFGHDDREGSYLEIRDDGHGMTREVIENAWCLVATPYKQTNALIQRGDRIRRVVGSKGLGRLSVARLGNRLAMLTQAPQSPCWEVIVDWSEVSAAADISQSAVGVREYSGVTPFQKTGTQLRIFDLTDTWDKNRRNELKDGLSRLLSPFTNSDEFNIFLSCSGNNEQVHIESAQFLSNPKYHIKGEVDACGNVDAIYRFTPFREDMLPKAVPTKLSWSQIHDLAQEQENWRFPHSCEAAKCGPFSFDIRAWDTDAEGIGQINEKYGIPRSYVRQAIRAHKGISVYRDGVLVLPKSERGLDWLSLDLRRVSRVGKRLSTSQLVGYVSISAKHNPHIEDTSDRERLSVCPEVEEFEEIIKCIVRALESKRNEEKSDLNRETPMTDLFASLSASELVTQVTELARSGAQADAVVPIARKLDEALIHGRTTIQRRFEYYSRLATVGTIAQMLVHEIRNRTTIIGRLLTFPKQEPELPLFGNQQVHVDRAEAAVNALEKLADRFSPLANRNFRSGRRHSILEERILDCLELQKGELRAKHIQCSVPQTHTAVAVDPAELDAVILNLVTNASYWLGTVAREKRHLAFALEPTVNGKRVTVFVHDAGPGIEEDDMERVFWPGVTRKPEGIGMGLTVAGELVEAYGGRIRVVSPGAKGGASFAFDLPCAKVNRENRA